MQKDDRNPARDRELGMDRPITRRDFLNGMAIGVSGIAASSLIPESLSPRMSLPASLKMLRDTTRQL